MAKYKCPTYGDCDRANAGEVFERSPGEDLKCPGCGTLLEAQAVETIKGGKKPLAVIVAGVALVLAGGTVWYVTKSPVEEAAPAGMVVASAPTVVAAAKVGGDKLLPSDMETSALRKDGDAQLANGDSTAAEQSSNKAAANEMLKSAVAKMGQGKLDEADQELREVLVRSPGHPLAYYNVAVLRLKQGKTDEALKEMEASFLSGFSHFDAMDQDADIDALRKDARFQKLVLQYRTSK
ncbi:hypothetical protein EHS17_09350 [Rhodobacteraceae bacterium CH30]|nr:hypothetical protein EHS17_09350 [Rhodobacteraceae bacterium CH30]